MPPPLNAGCRMKTPDVKLQHGQQTAVPPDGARRRSPLVSRLRALACLALAAVVAGCPGEHIVDPVVRSVLPAGQCNFSAFAPGMAGVRVLQTLGSAADDRVFAEEVAIQQQWYQTPTTYWILDDESPERANAYANSRGYILFGVHMYRKTIAQYGGLAVAGVLAHEGGHRIQQTAGWMASYPTVVTELEADAFSGFYMAVVKRWAWSQIEGYFANTYAAGSYYFNDPNFHGTPRQRLAAAYMGVNLANYALTQPRPPTWAEMHAIFMQNMPQILSSPVLLAPTLAPRAGSADADRLQVMNAHIARLPLADIASGRIRAPEVVPPPEQSAPRRWVSPAVHQEQ